MWVERTGARADAQEVELALRVVGVILEQNAELRDQQDETGDSLEKWLTPCGDLQRRLSAAEPAPAAEAAYTASRRLHDLVAGRARPAAGCGTAGLAPTVSGGRWKVVSCVFAA